MRFLFSSKCCQKMRHKYMCIYSGTSRYASSWVCLYLLRPAKMKKRKKKSAHTRASVFKPNLLATYFAVFLHVISPFGTHFISYFLSIFHILFQFVRRCCWAGSFSLFSRCVIVKLPLHSFCSSTISIFCRFHDIILGILHIPYIFRFSATVFFVCVLCIGIAKLCENVSFEMS